jgi:hypothetical protein
MYLKRYHEVSVSPSGIWRILKRANSQSVAGFTAL